MSQASKKKPNAVVEETETKTKTIVYPATVDDPDGRAAGKTEAVRRFPLWLLALAVVIVVVVFYLYDRFVPAALLTSPAGHDESVDRQAPPDTGRRWAPPDSGSTRGFENKPGEPR